jgi:sugar phosphate isomerase/epimerase
VIPVTLSTGSLYTFGTARAFEHAAAAGFDGVELVVDERWDTHQPEYLRRLMDEHGVPVLSVHSPFLGMSAWPRDEVARIERTVALAETLGARTVNAHVPYRVSDLTISFPGGRYTWPFLPPPESHARYARWLLDGGLESLQARTPVTIVLENLPARRFLGTRINRYALNTWEELSLFSKLCLDTTHCGTWGADPSQIDERLGNRVVHVHLSDWDGKYQHQPLGSGHLALDRFLRRLAERRYLGIVVVELTPQGLPVHDPDKLAAELRRNLAFCRTHLDDAPGPSQPALDVATRPSPATPAAAGAFSRT